MRKYVNIKLVDLDIQSITNREHFLNRNYDILAQYKRIYIKNLLPSYKSYKLQLIITLHCCKKQKYIYEDLSQNKMKLMIEDNTYLNCFTHKSFINVYKLQIL